MRLFSSAILKYLLSDRRFKLVFEFKSGQTPVLTCVIPVHNQENTIRDYLHAVLTNAESILELIIIDDSSEDATARIILQYLIFFEAQKLPHSIKFFQTQIPIHETRCDDFGFRQASAEFIFEIQADMKIYERGFDVRLVELLIKYPNIGLISCRGVHELTDLRLELRSYLDQVGIVFTMKSLAKACLDLLRKSMRKKTVKPSHSSPEKQVENLKSSEKVIFPEVSNGRAGFLGRSIDCIPEQQNKDVESLFERYRNRIWFGDSAMRGPVLVRRKDYLEIGGLDTSSFFQGLDDHDLCLRFKSLDMFIAFSPLYFSSPIHLGTGRKKKSFKSAFWIYIHTKVRSRNLQSSFLAKQLR